MKAKFMNKNLIIGVFVACFAALGGICGGCGEDDCSTSEMKSCKTSEDCVLVSCACCSYEAVSKGGSDIWYRLNYCRQGARICPAVVCPKRIAACENNLCVAK